MLMNRMLVCVSLHEVEVGKTFVMQRIDACLCSEHCMFVICLISMFFLVQTGGHGPGLPASAEFSARAQRDESHPAPGAEPGGQLGGPQRGASGRQGRAQR